MKPKTPNKIQSPKVTYHYVKPKNEAEAKEQTRLINRAFDILFEEVEKRMKERETNK